MEYLRTTIIFFMLALYSTSSAMAVTEIRNLRYWVAPDHTRIVFDCDDDVQYTVEKSEQKVVLKLHNAVLSQTMSREFILNQRSLKQVRLLPLAANILHIELYLEKLAEIKVFTLKKFQDKPYRLVVDILFPEVEKETADARKKLKSTKKDKIIVIDPGHGGDDPGARGRRGTNEKDVVLEIGKKLRDILNKGNGTRAFLTREGDYYVPFKKRLNVAREIDADLFISIHADAARNRAAKGSSVYCLSTGAASSEAAKILAKKENLADIYGGVIGDSMNSDEADPIILDMFQNSTINKSKTFGANVLSGLCKINDIKFSLVQTAPFRVLKLPEIPAVLIETAYISNPKEERLLREQTYQRRIAVAIAQTVREYFALPEIKASSAIRIKSKTEEHLNAARGKNPEPVYFLYEVKKGDTIGKIAHQYGTTIAEVLRLNHMKLSDPLYIGRTLKMPVR